MKVFLIAAITADGFIGRDSHHAADWTSKADKQVFMKLTKEAGVMIMGLNTFNTIGRALPGRKSIVYTERPEELADIENVEPTSLEPTDLIKKLEADGYNSVAICGGSQTYGMFLSSSLVDEVYLTIEPVLFGSGVPLSRGADLTKLELLDTSDLGHGSVLVHYKVISG